MLYTMGGKVAIVTGSSSGVGEAIAIHLASLGYRLTVTGRNAENLLKVVNKCKEHGLADKEILSMVGDVKDVGFVKKIVNDTNEYFNRLDLLVNNAGVGCMKHLSETTVDDYDLVMSTNLRSAFFASQAALPFLKESKGSVVNVSSCGSLQPSKLCLYTMSKAGMDQLTLNTAKAFAEYGIRVNSVNPGVMVTNLFNAADFSHNKVMDMVQWMHVLQNRPVKLDEVAAAVTFLASDHAAMITGCILPIDGGFHLGK